MPAWKPPDRAPSFGGRGGAHRWHDLAFEAAGPPRVGWAWRKSPNRKDRIPTTASPPADIITAALLVIGDEILSGRTKDKNIGHIAEYLTNVGIDLREVCVVPYIEEEIVSALNALRSRYASLFAPGGMGPTKDSITADCVAKAFGVPI